jgi:hypothetical protein
VSSTLSSALSEEVALLTGGQQKKNTTEFLVQHMLQDWTALQKILGKNSISEKLIFVQNATFPSCFSSSSRSLPSPLSLFPLPSSLSPLP